MNNHNHIFNYYDFKVLNEIKNQEEEIDHSYISIPDEKKVNKNNVPLTAWQLAFSKALILTKIKSPRQLETSEEWKAFFDLVRQIVNTSDAS